MKKKWWIIIGIIVILIIIGFIIYNYPSKQYNNIWEPNASIYSIYPELINNSYLNTKEYISTGDPIYDEQLVINASEGLLSYQDNKDVSSADWESKISCSHAQTKTLRGVSGFYGGEMGSSESIIECDTNYWVVLDTNVGWRIYGTFEKK